MNSLRLYVLISCLIVVTVQQSRTAIRPKRQQPPMKSNHPTYWRGRNRELYLQSKNVWYIQIERDGRVSGSKSQTEAAVLQTYSGSRQTVALKGKLAGKYLCMNSEAKIYANESPDRDDCFFFEEYQPNSYNTYQHSFHRRGDMKNYLAIDDDGTIRVGNSTDEVQVYFLPSAVINSTVKPPVTTTTTTLMTVTTVRPPLSTSTVAPIKRKLEKTRKRRRRWCKLLIKGRLERKPQKYITRCKHDCNILKTMLDNPKRYKRKCEKQRQRRRRRNRKIRGPRTKNRKRHHHGESSKSRTNNRGRGRERKRTSNKSPLSSQTHNIDVT